ncbi:putative leucine-rich repeat receptor-like serine/threonine-protein kinase [Hibiscus syriacus]|uniref:Leucine-rich repeat receptor-like serine/threonine-protein kinase n=1 Tax=Hibiscus syriacus TaxID=106335 RepID=A0A6A2XSX3_HIBSY|nr:calcium/calmodulin-regulated receptor-like kinase 2 [Hibiscus syriacus]KAE8659367.1 putative leucine-rich repeat receptor-like serine/threonine-protein kinase [Hibiscus syriacus]
MVHKGDLVVIGISVGLALGILIASLVFFGLRWYRKYVKLRRTNELSVTVLPIRTNGFGTSTDFSASLSNSVAVEVPEYHQRSSPKSWWSPHSNDRVASASGLPKYSYKDVQKATQNFTTILGEGSFGPVYKATMPTGGVAAVKVLASDSHQGEKEFHTEVCLLGRLHHRNLVNLVGYCVDKGKYMLIYEFMSNGSLASLLYGEGERGLNWDERLQIALDISHGIEYLHEGAVPSVIHRDLKSANILLDESMRAKVADFGLSKEEVFDGRNSGIKGTYGYIDPEYISTNKFTMKSDVYSFGVIIFELITAIHPHQNLMEYVNLAAMSPDGVDEILDKQLAGEYNIEEVRQLAKIAHKCLHKSPRKRPSIGEVTQAILKIKQRRLGKEDTMSMTETSFSRIMSRIQEQHVDLTKLANVKEVN